MAAVNFVNPREPIMWQRGVVAGGSLIFGQPNQRPKPENPLTLKNVYLDPNKSGVASNPQPLDANGIPEQPLWMEEDSTNGNTYSLVILDSNGTQLTYIPIFNPSDLVGGATNVSQEVADNAEAALASQVAAEASAQSASIDADHTSEDRAQTGEDRAASELARDEAVDARDEAVDAAQGIAIRTFQNISDLRSSSGLVIGEKINLIGYSQEGVGGGDLYVSSDTTSADDGGTIFINASGQRIKRQLDGFVTPEMFGALGDDVTDDLASFTAMFNYCNESGSRAEGNGGSSYLLSERINNGFQFNGNGCQFNANSGCFRIDKASPALEPTEDYESGKKVLTFADTSTIQNGSIVSIRSTDLFNTERSLYYKGITTTCEVISPTEILILDTAPFDMAASTLTTALDLSTGVYFYTPQYVDFRNFTMTGNKSTSTRGIFIEGVTGIIENVTAESYVEGISLQRCVDVAINNCDSRNCVVYGGVTRSCTGIITDGGQWETDGGIGFDTGGAEPCFRLTWRNGAYNSSGTGGGLSHHANIWDSRIENCSITDFNFAGHCKIIGGTISSNVGFNDNFGYLGVANDQDYCSYEFDGVTFLNDITIRLSGFSQVSPVGRNQVGEITFKNCPGAFRIYLDLPLTSSLPDEADIKSVNITNCDCSFITSSNIGILHLERSTTSNTSRMIDQLDNGGTIRGRINKVTMTDVLIPDGNQKVRVRAFDTAYLERCSTDAPGVTFRFEDAVGNMVMRDCLFGTTSIFQTDDLDRLLSDNTQITINSEFTANITTYIQQNEY